MLDFNKNLLVESLEYTMPFGKYKGLALCDLPLYYLEWFLRGDGFPAGKLGAIMALIYEVKLNGLDEILAQLKMDISKR